MTLSAHIVVGSAVGLATGNPALGFFAGFLSHHIIDAIPHSDAGSLGADINNIFKNTRGLVWVAADIFLAFLIFCFILFKTDFSSAVFWGAVGGAAPDIIDNSPFWSPTLRKVFPTNYYHKFHDTLHWTIKDKKILWVGVTTQVIAVLGSLIYIYLF